MAKNLALEAQSEPARKEALPIYPYTFRRVFLCGHPGEFIAVSRLPPQERLTHTLITLAEYDQCAGEHMSRQTYTLERCRRCATEHREKHCSSLECGPKRASLRSIAAYQGEAVCLEQIANRMKNGFERVLTRLEKVRGDEDDVAVHARIPESEHKEEQRAEVSGGNVPGMALRFVGSPSELQQERRVFESPTSPPQIRGGGYETLNAWSGSGVLQSYHQRKDNGFQSHRSQVFSVNGDVRTPTAKERREVGGGSFQETISQGLDRVRHKEDDPCVDQGVSLSRFSSSSSSASDKSKPWWKVGKPREDRQQQSSSPVPLLARKDTLKLWKRIKRSSTACDEKGRVTSNHNRQLKHSTSCEESMQESTGSFRPVRRSIARFRSLSEGKTSVLNHNDQLDQLSSTTSTAKGVGSRHSGLMLDINKELPPLPTA